MNRRQNCGFAVNNGVDNAIVNELTGCNKCSPNSTTPMQCLRVLVRLDVFMFSFYELAVCWLDGDRRMGKGLTEAIDTKLPFSCCSLRWVSTQN